MALNNISAIKPFNTVKEVKNNKIQEVINNQTSPIKQLPTPSAELLQVMNGVKLGKARPQPIKFTPDGADDYLSKHPANVVLLYEDRENIKKVMCKGDKEASNIQMQLELVATGALDRNSLKHYWETGKMSENLAEDIDMIYEGTKANKVINDIYVPTVKTQAEGTKSAKIGDVFQVKDEKNVYVKTDENSSKQLGMDKEMFVKLFPPAKRFTTMQKSIGDCYLVSTLNTLMANPKTRVALYDTIKQDGKDISVKFQNGFGEYKYERGEMPLNRVDKYSLGGAVGMKILEDAYGLDSVNKADATFKKVMGEKIANKKVELENAPADKKAVVQKSLEGHQKRLSDYLEAKSNPNKNIVVCRSDNMFNIFYDEDENGMMFSELGKDPDNKQVHFRSSADFYRGSLGGYNFEVMQRFGFGGFRQMNLDLESDKKLATELMNKEDFNQDYIMTGGTRANGSRVENPVAKSAGVYGFHAYTLEPHKDEKGDLKVRCTNPWNTSYDADISYNDFLKYYDSVSIVDVNSYEKKLPLEKQPIAYDSKGPVINRKAEGGDIWYINDKNKNTQELKD